MSRITAREKILAAAAAVAREHGAGNMSLDAVAARAGVSKGGLLYHFPTKAALMRAAVEAFMGEFETNLDTKIDAGECGLMSCYVQLSLQECAKPANGSAGVLAAIAEDPDFLKPVTELHRRLLARIQAETHDSSEALLIYLAVEGLRSVDIFNLDILSKDDLARIHRNLIERAEKLDDAA